jgi:hypothetical protein
MIFTVLRRFVRQLENGSRSILPRRRTRQLHELDKRDAGQYADIERQCGALRELRQHTALG